MTYSRPGSTTHIFSEFIAAGGFLFLNELSSTAVSNFTYNFNNVAAPNEIFVSGGPPVTDEVNDGSDVDVATSLFMWTGSETSIQDSAGTTMTQGSTMGNTYSRTQSLSFAPPKPRATKTDGGLVFSWGYSSTQQTSYTQYEGVTTRTMFSENYTLAYGNILYLVGSQLYGSLVAVPFLGINTLTFTPCTTALCAAAGVDQRSNPTVTQDVFGTFSGSFYSASTIVSVGESSVGEPQSCRTTIN